jgi:hypothetical protein
VGLWLGIGGGVIVAVIILVVAVLLANIGSSGTGGLPSTASGPSACVLAGSPSGGSGPWKLVKPTTLCGMPQDTTPGGLQADQELLSATQLIFNPLAGQPSMGNETSGFAVSYEVPEHLGFTRYVNFVGFDGTFNPQVAVSSLAQQDENPDIPGNVFHPVPAGPHGGAMECAPSYSAEECIFATSTTLGDMMIDDTLGQLTGSHTGTNAIRIRDALEVPA